MLRPRLRPRCRGLVYSSRKVKHRTMYGNVLSDLGRHSASRSFCRRYAFLSVHKALRFMDRLGSLHPRQSILFHLSFLLKNNILSPTQRLSYGKNRLEKWGFRLEYKRISYREAAILQSRLRYTLTKPDFINTPIPRERIFVSDFFQGYVQGYVQGYSRDADV